MMVLVAVYKAILIMGNFVRSANIHVKLVKIIPKTVYLVNL